MHRTWWGKIIIGVLVVGAVVTVIQEVGGVSVEKQGWILQSLWNNGLTLFNIELLQFDLGPPPPT